jgi:hypothetical protein
MVTTQVVDRVRTELGQATRAAKMVSFTVMIMVVR